MNILFDNSYARLPEYFHRRVLPTHVKQPELIIFNQELAAKLNISINDLNDKKKAQIFSGNIVPTGAEPIATVYAGHQFGGFSPQLGDGRAILLGEVLNNGERYDLQLKGSGPTPYSRSGDGRSALGPVLREYLLSEAMYKLGIPTTRALAAVTTGEQVARDTLVAGGIITRVAKGFVRVGTFEYFSSQGNQEAIKQLADYEISRHYPECKKADNPYISFLAAVIDNQAKLITHWMNIGFIHGVMNTDNMAISGETIDYGPCAFMDDFSHNRVYSSIDRNGRYAYNNQPQIAQWNLIRLAETLLPLFIDKKSNDEKQDGKIAVAIAEDLLKKYQQQYHDYWLAGMRQKLGFELKEEADADLINELLNCMEANQADFTLTFYYLSQLTKNKDKSLDQQFIELFDNDNSIKTWLKKWRQRIAIESISDKQRSTKMLQVNPVYIPRNHQIERAIRAAEDENNFSVFHDLHTVLQKPFEYQESNNFYMLPPQADEVVHQTFCGT